MSADPNLWDNQEKAQKLMSEKNTLEASLDAYDGYVRSLDDYAEMVEFAESENDEVMLEELQTNLDELQATVKHAELEALLSGEADANDTYLEVHAGSGGTEAMDWAQMLLRMYTRWAETHHYKVEYIEETEGEVAGLKSATIKISGHNAYGWLKSVSGVMIGGIIPLGTKPISLSSLFSNSDYLSFSDNSSHRFSISSNLLRLASNRSLISLIFA